MRLKCCSRCTTSPASSISTSSPRSTRRCAARTWRARSTGWRGCPRGGRAPVSPPPRCRRLVRTAAEDVGIADPRALTVALAAKDAYHFLGSPEGELALAEATVYLATAPKSNRVYEAFGRATDAAAEHAAAPVPLHIRNAPTKLMEELGYGAGYKYAHAYEDAYVPQDYLPEALRGAKWYEPTDFGYEKTVKERMEFWKKLRERLARETGNEKRDT